MNSGSFLCVHNSLSAENEAYHFHHLLVPQSAIKILTEVVRSAPNVAQPYFTLALVHESLGDLPRALGFVDVGLSLQPSNTEEMRHAAELAEKDNNTDYALRMWRKVPLPLNECLMILHERTYRCIPLKRAIDLYSLLAERDLILLLLNAWAHCMNNRRSSEKPVKHTS